MNTDMVFLLLSTTRSTLNDKRNTFLGNLPPNEHVPMGHVESIDSSRIGKKAPEESGGGLIPLPQVLPVIHEVPDIMLCRVRYLPDMLL